MRFSFKQIINIFGFCLLLSALQLTRLTVSASDNKTSLNQTQMRQELTLLVSEIERHSAFSALEPIRLHKITAAIDTLLYRYPEQISRQRFRDELTKLVAMLDDPGMRVFPTPASLVTLDPLNPLDPLDPLDPMSPHQATRLSLNTFMGEVSHNDTTIAQSNQHNNSRNPGVLPLTLQPYFGAWLALDDQGYALDPIHPFITHIDGLPLDRWVDACKLYIPAPQKLSQQQQVHWLNKLDTLRQDMGLATRDEVLLTLSDTAQGDANTQMRLSLSDSISPMVNSQNLRPHRSAVSQANAQPTGLSDNRLVNGVGLRRILAQVSKSEVNTAQLITVTDLNQFKPASAATNALTLALSQGLTVLDIRHAEGDSDVLLQLLAQQFSRPSATFNADIPAQHIIALAKYRRSEDFKGDFLRPLRFIPFNEFNFFEQVTFQQLSQSIDIPFATHFGDWYGRRAPLLPASAPRAEANKPSLVLIIGPECRRECEWIAYFAKTIPEIVLIGEATSGDLGRRYGFELPHSATEIEVTASLIYSTDGELISGIGTQPDIVLTSDTQQDWPGLLTVYSPGPGPGPGPGLGPSQE